jgi:hypothetical protein
MNKLILDGFPYSKEEFHDLCATVDTLIMEVFHKASSKYPSAQSLQILKGYQSLKYPLMAIWEHYGFGKVEDISLPTTPLLYYQAFKVDTIDTLNKMITGYTAENPFNFYGVIPNSEKILEKMLIAYRHLLKNLLSGNLHFNNTDDLLKSILHKSFEFNATSYEIYESGCCIRHETCNTYIFTEHSIYIGMRFRIINNPTYIDDKFSLATSSEDLLEDRVQYGRLRPIDNTNGVSSKPIVCNIFPQNGILRFATPNPLRLVEFSGIFKRIN